MSGEGKRCLVEDNVPRNNDPIRGDVEAFVAFVIGRVPKKRAQGGAGGKFVRGGGGEVGVTRAAESPEIMIGGLGAMKGKEGSAHVEGLGGEAVQQVGGCSKRISPIGRGHGSLEQQGANDIVGGADSAFSLAVLLGGIGAGHAKGDPFGKKESTRSGVVKLPPIVTLDRLDGTAELGVHISEEIGEGRESIRL